MKLLVLCAIFMNIYVLEKCAAKCDQYYLIVKESSCERENLRPQKIRDINWDEITYPCNSTDAEVIPFNKECVLEVEFMSTTLECNSHIKKVNHQTHIRIPDKNKAMPDRYARIKLASTTTSTTPKTDYIETVDKNITTNEEIDKSMYDVNIIYINQMENHMNTSQSITETNNTNDEVSCDYAETMCSGKGKPESYKFNGLNETTGALKITILRDVKSPIQPIFTGYIPNDSNTHLTPSFKDFKSVNITCDVLKHYNCNIDDKTVRQVNIYLKTSYVQNNTVTKYFNCTNNVTTSMVNVSLDLKCNNTDFDKHNKFTLLNPEPYVTTTETPDNVTEQNILDNIPNGSVDSQMNVTKYDLNIIYLNDDNESNRKQQTVHCAYANICSDEENPEIEKAKSLQMSINRDENSPIQPVFTGYFDNHTKIQSDSLIKYFKSVTLECAILIRSSCKKNIRETAMKDINIYLKSNYVQNDTITRYPNCTKSSMSSTLNNTLYFQCDDVSFADHNPHISLTPQLINKTNEVKVDNKTDMEIITRVCVAEKNVNNEIHFKNCSNNLHFGTATNETIHENHENNDNSTVTDNFENAITNTFNAMTKDISSAMTKDNLIKFLIAANDNNCTKNLVQSISKGKIINSDISYIGKRLGTAIYELHLSNCTESIYTNNTQPHPQKELLILLQEYASNSSNSKFFNESLKDAKDKQYVILQCDLLKRNSSTNTASDRNILKCQSIDLDIHDNTTDNKITKEEKKVQKNQFTVRINETQESKITNCTATKTDCKTNNTHNTNTKKVIVNEEAKKEIRNYAERKPDYSKGIFNRRTDIVNGAIKSGPSEENNEVEKILLIGLASIAGVSMLVVLALRFRRKPTSQSNSENNTPPASTAQPNAMQMDETAF